MNKEIGSNSTKKRWLILGAAIVAILAVVGVVFALLFNDSEKGNAVRSDLYWNVDRGANIDPDTGLSTRTPSPDGVYRILFAYDGKQVELPVIDKNLVNYIDTMDVMNLTRNEEGYITGVKAVEDVASVFGQKMYVQEVTEDTIIINSSIAMTGKKLTVKITQLLQAYNMSGKGEFNGQRMELKDLQMLDTVSVYGTLASKDEETIATHIFVTKRWETGKVYWRVSRSYDSKAKATSRKPDENGVYTVPFYCDGETVELKFKDKALVDNVDYASTTSCYFGFEFDADGYAVKILSSNKATHTVVQCERFDIVELNEDGSYVAADTLGTTGKKVQGVVGENCAIYDISTAAKAEGAINRKLDSLHLNDRVYIWTDTVGKPVLIYVTARRVDSPAYYNPNPQYDTEAKKTTRTPNAEGYYEIDLLMAGETELQTYYVKDVKLANSIDKAADLFVGLKVGEGNVVEFVYDTESVFGNTYFCRGYSVTEASSSIVILAKGKTVKNGVLAEGCKIWDVSDTQRIGEETAFREGDLVYAVKAPSGEIINAYIVQRAEKEGSAGHP